MKYKALKCKQGVTILEVLFSIGIIMMGLLGIASLIMVAGSQLTQGIRQDAFTNLALSAEQEFKSRNYNRADRWLCPHPNFKLGKFTGYGAIQSEKTICFDPYGIAKNMQTGGKDIDNDKLIRYGRFPSNAKLSMFRVTTKSLFHPGEKDIDNLIRLELARMATVSNDALAIKQPDSKTELPTQLWIKDNSDKPLKRIGFGNYATLGPSEFSWMATIVPLQGGNNEFILSMVIFYNRIFEIDNPDVLVEEHNFSIHTYQDNQIEIYSKHPDPSKHMKELEALKHNGWLLLGNSNGFRWSRISFIDDKTVSRTTADGERLCKTLTLERTKWATNPPTQATLVPRVVGVFEKTTSITHSNTLSE